MAKRYWASSLTPRPLNLPSRRGRNSLGAEAICGAPVRGAAARTPNDESPWPTRSRDDNRSAAGSALIAKGYSDGSGSRKGHDGRSVLDPGIADAELASNRLSGDWSARPSPAAPVPTSRNEVGPQIVPAWRCGPGCRFFEKTAAFRRVDLGGGGCWAGSRASCLLYTSPSPRD